MKKVTTNITIGQILFILLTFLFASLIFFYLGAKFGPNVLDMGNHPAHLDDPILPDEKMEAEIKRMIAAENHVFVFQEALQSKDEMKDLTPQVLEQIFKETPDDVPKKLIASLKKDFASDPALSDDKSAAAKPGPTATEQVAPKGLAITDIKPSFETEVGLKVKVASPQALESQVGATEVVAEAPTAPVQPQYSLQLGAFTNEKKAERERARWQKRGFNVRLVALRDKLKGRWYRLQLGGYTDVKDASKAQSVIQQKFNHSARIVSVR